MMDEMQARAAMVLYDSRQFDTADIARLLGASEAEVHRVLRAARDLVRQFYRDLKDAGADTAILAEIRQ
jgi:DNA-directed RNA polymerase specialized sigma24 family protein